MSNSQSIALASLELSELACITGGAGAQKSQVELRELARTYCPVTFDKFKNAPALTRRMGERCLDEAGLGMFKNRLDAYFPRR